MDRPPLPFRVLFASSASDLHPATELELAVYCSRPHPMTRGWVSHPALTFPQELGLEFEKPTRLTALSLISHEYYIASRVEIFLGHRRGAQRASLAKGLEQYQAARFERLGFVRFGDNVSSQFEAREQRTVRDINPPSAEFVRLVFHRNHYNHLNQSGQVGLLAALFYGDQSLPPARDAISNDTFAAFEHRDASAVDQALRDLGLLELSRKPALTSAAPKCKSTSDPESQRQIATLRERLGDAVAAENYALAGELKRAIGRVEDIGTQVVTLRGKITLAASREDYDASISIREELGRLERVRDGIVGSFTHGGAAEEPASACAKTADPDIPTSEAKSSLSAPPSVGSKDPTPKARGAGSSAAWRRRQLFALISATDPLEEAVAKALLVRSDLPRPQALAPDERDDAELFTGSFGKAAMECFYAPHSALRLLALELIARALPTLPGTKSTLFKTTIVLLLHAFDDCDSSVRLASVELCDALFDGGEVSGAPRSGATLSHVTFGVRTLEVNDINRGLYCVLPVLLRLANDESSDVSVQAVESVLRLRQAPYLESECSGITAALTNFALDTEDQHWQQLGGQANVLRALIAQQGFTADSKTGVVLHLTEIASFAVTCLHHPHPRTKGAAMDLVMEVYRHKGRKCEYYLKELDPSLMQVLRSAFLEIDQKVEALNQT